ncbi:DUF4136 domain-containing protein [Haloferula chungangensis]|uniref:DUF4136 domain-containing protein n=1 Tax=Haloferula chungangensis TaxID=1048331 RepID=A0ABW2L355_9BACT
MIARIALSALAFAVISCSSVDMPKGSSKGYTSARLVRPEKPPTYDKDIPNQASANRMIQKSLAANFRANNFQVGEGSSDLIVGYLVLVQNNYSTLALDDYFGYGRDSDAIVDKAQSIGVVKSTRPDAFEAGTIVVDVIDAKTNELVYRGHATRDIFKNTSDASRQANINSAITEALQDFFR